MTRTSDSLRSCRCQTRSSAQPGGKLARMIRELNELKVTHTAIRAEQKAERQRLTEKIAGLAQTISQQDR